jgi:hypothetical protein
MSLLKQLQQFREIMNSDRDNFPKAQNAIAIEQAICARNRDTLPQIARAITSTSGNCFSDCDETAKLTKSNHDVLSSALHKK